MIALGFLLGVAIAAPVFFAIGLFAGIDRSVRHTPRVLQIGIGKHGQRLSAPNLRRELP